MRREVLHLRAMDKAGNDGDRSRIGVLGGSFDPVHQGHIGIARAAWRHLALNSLHFIPLRHLPHRPPLIASAEQRQAMLDLTLAGNFPGQALVDTCELRRPGPSCTIDTLRSLRERFPEAVLLWLLGEDVFADLESWQDWQDLLHYAHLVVITREAAGPRRLSRTLKQWRDRFLLSDPVALLARPCGHIHRLNIRPIPVSSSDIRRRLADGRSVHACLPVPVQDYILTHRPYPMADSPA